MPDSIGCRPNSCLRLRLVWLAYMRRDSIGSTHVQCEFCSGSAWSNKPKLSWQQSPIKCGLSRPIDYGDPAPMAPMWSTAQLNQLSKLSIYSRTSHMRVGQVRAWLGACIQAELDIEPTRPFSYIFGSELANNIIGYCLSQPKFFQFVHSGLGWPSGSILTCFMSLDPIDP